MKTAPPFPIPFQPIGQNVCCSIHMTGNTQHHHRNIPHPSIGYTSQKPTRTFTHSHPRHHHRATGPPTTLNQNSNLRPNSIPDFSKGPTSRSLCFEDTPSSRAGKNSAGETGAIISIPPCGSSGTTFNHWIPLALSLRQALLDPSLIHTS